MSPNDIHSSYEWSTDQIGCTECTSVSDKHSIIGVENKITIFEII